MTEEHFRRNQTIKCELVRSLSAGFLEAGSSTLFLLIAIRYFDAGPFLKGLIAGGSAVGNLLSPFLVVAFQGLRIRASKAASFLLLFTGIAAACAGATNDLTLFALYLVLGSAAYGCTVPFLAQVYQENYPATERGRIMGKVFSVRIVVAAAAALIGGQLLQGRIEQYPAFMALLAAITFLAAWAMYLCPSTKPPRVQARELLVGVQALRKERTFQVSILAWTLVGLGSFLVMPLRTEYLSNARYGLNLTELEIALLIVAIPSLGKLLVYPLWGRLFDRYHFTTVRILASMTSLLSFLTFFTSDSLTGLIIGSFFQGIALAGGEITWTLWTTRLAEGSRVASYTAIHTFFTGVRGVLGPQLGFHLAEKTAPVVVAFVGAALFISSTVVFLIEGRMELKIAREQKNRENIR